MTSMHQNLLAAAARLTPWGGLLRRLPLPLTRAHSLALPRAGATTCAAVESTACARQVDSPVRASRPSPTRQTSVSKTPRPARAMLRVLRIVEADQVSASSGRIVMCGRMADVCAELERMVEREAALLARP